MESDERVDIRNSRSKWLNKGIARLDYARHAETRVGRRSKRLLPPVRLGCFDVHAIPHVEHGDCFLGQLSALIRLCLDGSRIVGSYSARLGLRGHVHAARFLPHRYRTG